MGRVARIGALLAVASAALAAAGCGGGGAQGAEPEAGIGPEAGVVPAERCGLPRAGEGGRPYATLPFTSPAAPDSLYPILRRGLEREGFDICAEDRARGVLATSARTVRAPDGERRRVAIGVYVTGVYRGSEGQLWVVQSDPGGSKATLEAIARRLRTSLVGGE